MRKKYIFGGVVFLTLTMTGCYYDSEEHLYGVQECGPKEISYSEEVAPIINQNCSVSGCHGDVQSPVFTDVSTVQNHATNIVVRIKNGTMPPDGPLTEDEIQTISCWVDQGAKDN